MALLPNSVKYTGRMGGGGGGGGGGMNTLLSSLLESMEASAQSPALPASLPASQPSRIPTRPRLEDLFCSDLLQALAKDEPLSESPQTSSSAGSLSCSKCEVERCRDCRDCAEGRLSPRHQQAPPHCEAHCEPFRFYCETCSRAVCQECTLWEHKEHISSPLAEAVAQCRARARHALESGKTGTVFIKNSIDRAVAISRTVERDAAQISVKIRKAMRHFVLAAEERERQLLEKVSRMRQLKLDELSEQMRGLRDALAGLANTNERLQRALESDGPDILQAEQRSERQIELFAGLYKSLQPRDEGFLFVPPNYDVALEMKKQGDVVPAVYGNGIASAGGAPVASPVVAPLLAPAAPKRPAGPLRSLRRGAGQCIPGSAAPVVALPRPGPPGAARPLLAFAPDGHEDGQVSRPWGLCVDREGNILVADRRNNRVQVFGSDGVFRLKFGSKGAGPGEFDLPAGIATDPLGRIVVVDKDNHRVQTFTSGGVFVLAFGGYGKGCGQFRYPWDVAVNSERQIVVTDSRNYRIQLFSSEGAYVTMLTFDGANHSRMLKGLTTPRGVCFTPPGDVIISDFENHRLLLIDSTLTTILGAKGYEGPAIGEFSRPSGVVCDDEGNIIVADSKNQRVIAFTPYLEFLWALEVKGTGPEENDRPTDIALTPAGRLVAVVEGLPDARDLQTPPANKAFVLVF